MQSIDGCLSSPHTTLALGSSGCCTTIASGIMNVLVPDIMPSLANSNLACQVVSEELVTHCIQRSGVRLMLYCYTFFFFLLLSGITQSICLNRVSCGLCYDLEVIFTVVILPKMNLTLIA